MGCVLTGSRRNIFFSGVAYLSGRTNYWVISFRGTKGEGEFDKNVHGGPYKALQVCLAFIFRIIKDKFCCTYTIVCIT